MAEEGTTTQAGGSEARATTALDHVLRGIQDAVEKAQRLANTQHLEMLRFFVDQVDVNDPTSPYVPRTVKLLIDQPQKGRNEDGSVPKALLEVPIVSVVPVQTLSLKEFEISMQLHVSHINPPSRRGQGAGAYQDKDQEAEFKVDLASTSPAERGGRGSRTIDVKMKFVGEQAPEGVLRLIERINEAIVEKEP